MEAQKSDFITGYKTEMRLSRNGRRRKMIEGPEIVTEIDEVMSLLISMKNDNRSWQMIADELGTKHTKISSALARKVALGLCKSEKVEAILGLREETATVPISQVRLRPRNPNPRKKRRRFTCEDPDGRLTETIDAICASEETTRPALLAWMVRNHLDFHGRLDCDYRELEY